MKFFDEFIDTAKAAADMTVQKSEEIIEKGKTQLKIYKLRAKLKEAYAYLGLRTYIMARKGESLDGAFKMQIEEIDTLRKSISELKEQADLIKYYEKCKNCGSFNDKEDEFCLSCGAALKNFKKTVYTANFDTEQE